MTSINEKYPWIIPIEQSGNISESELIDLTKKILADITFSSEIMFIALLSDRISAGQWSNENAFVPRINLSLLLDFRIFSNEGELHFIRSHIGDKFKARYAHELNLEKDEYFEETQYLDIDTMRTTSGRNGNNPIFNNEYYAIAGGLYPLPSIQSGEFAEKITIVNYISYDKETGNMKNVDFRIKSIEGVTK